jgi:Domain of unknown function (DUF4329)
MPQMQIVRPDTGSPGYDSVDAAADAVSKSFGSNPDREEAAVVFQRPDGTHVYSTVAPQDEHDNFALRAQMPKGYKLSGIVHSHPGDDDNAQWFSPKDLETAHSLNVPSYVRYLKDSSIRRYTPGKTKTQHTEPRAVRHSSQDMSLVAIRLIRFRRPLRPALAACCRRRPRSRRRLLRFPLRHEKLHTSKGSRRDRPTRWACRGGSRQETWRVGPLSKTRQGIR